MSVYLSREQARAVDRLAMGHFQMSGLVLMENASAGTARMLVSKCQDGDRVLVVAGAGNNGGDGLAIARHLYIQGISVAVLWVADPTEASADCLANWRILTHTRIPTSLVSPAELGSTDAGLVELLLENEAGGLAEACGGEFTWMVDALLGTGAKGPARLPVSQVIQWINHQDVSVLAVDLPSGLDCDEGLTGGAVIQADLTGTFVGLKKCFANSEVQNVVGQIHVIPIGTPPEVLEMVLTKQTP